MRERRPNKGYLTLAIATFLGVAFAVLPAYAQVDLGLNYGTSLGLTTQDIRTTIGGVINAFLGLLGIIAVVLILYAGFVWMTAGGDDEKVTTAKRLITNAVIGLVIILAAFAITQFIFRAIGAGTGTNIGSGGGCPPGQNCGFGSGGGGGGGFVVNGITPVGPGPSDAGWPKNYAFTIGFNAAVEPSSITASSVQVTKCNARINGSGEPQPFDEADCDTAMTGTRTVEGSKVIFKPDASEEEDPTDFDSDFWYKIRIQGLDIKDLAGRPLFCPPTPPGPDGDMSSTTVRRDLCDRAAAFNDLRDVEPPTVLLTAPSYPPATCNALVPVLATANDDFLVSRVDFRINGGTNGLVDAAGDPLSTDINGDLVDPFVSTSLYIDTSVLIAGETYVVTATAYDGVPQASEANERSFTVAPAHCCNLALDADLGETGIDCGVDSQCGACNGGACTNDEQCASGFCDPQTNRCAERPVIEGISPISAGPGSLITISGRFFGANAGSIVFLGADTDGNGDPEGDADDVTAQACAPAAWNGDQVIVAVPTGAVTGPVLLRTSFGSTDRSDDDHGPLVGAFSVGTTIRPGICYLAPNTGAPGISVVAHGSGFGEAMGESVMRFGEVSADIAAGGWTAQAVTALAPPSLSEGTYPVRILIGGPDGQQTNAVNFSLRLPESGAPRIISIEPTSAPRGSYVTIRGSGFGNTKGIVRFHASSTDDIGIGLDPVCDENWKDNAIVVKVPLTYTGGLALLEQSHAVEIETASPARTSNRVSFSVVSGLPGPGLCAIQPDNGPAGTNVTVLGEGFGSGPGGAPQNVMKFSANASGTQTRDASVYGQWSSGSITAAVPGSSSDPATWPVTGPVSIIAANRPSGNSLPFTVQDCNAGATCGEGTICCANGSCQTSCTPVARESAYGWNFSTDLLPSLPQVVVRASCDVDAGTIQSPTPYTGSTDACKNAVIALEITHSVDPLTVDNGAVAQAEGITFEECGSGTFDAATCVPVPIARPVTVLPSATGGSVITFAPALSYPSSGEDAGTGFLKTATWYRVTVVSRPDSGVGVRDALGRYLDGDYDRKQGGDFVSTFKTRNSGTPCAVTNVGVIPSAYVIDHEGAPASLFDAALQASNCNILRCNQAAGAALDYLISWASVPFAPLDIGALLENGCRAPVEGAQETAAGAPAKLNVSVTPVGQTLSKDGHSDVTVKFTDPVVASVMPTASCTEACINAAIGARFNVAMDADSITASGNVALSRCRNASCNEPMALGLGGAVRTLSLVFDPADTSPDPAVIGFDFVGDSSLLQSGTFYQVTIKAGPGGVRSRSGVNLTGLNAPQAYVWKFRTKDDTTACSVSRVAVRPERTLLRYVGERTGLSLNAFGPVDECSTGGQQLNAWNHDWQWGIQPNPVLEGFLRAVPSAAGLDYAVDVEPVLNTNPVAKPGCTSQCTLAGSQNKIPQCGNGVREAGEDCDTAIPSDSGHCTAQCLWDGLSASCGNGIIEAGETCEVTGGVWNGCKNPDADIQDRPELNGLGCVSLGSASTTGSVCGDGFVSDGESCDDRNAANGDGCSSQCERQGSAPACTGVTPPGQSCISYCGNGLIEPGEDRGCDLGVGNIAPGCNVATCVHIGSSPALCGNGRVDTGEDAECEAGGSGAPEYCTADCLLKGSSAYYDVPSFCGDQIVGYGEAEECEQVPDVHADPVQYVVAKNYDPNAGMGKTSTVTATTLGVPTGSEGSADVSLSCTCKTLPTAGEQNAFCADIGVAAGLDLACANSGCCMARPTVTMQEPVGRNDACRNSLIMVTFDQEMDADSVRQNMLVGFDNENDACPQGTTEVPPLAALSGSGIADGAGFWGRVWNAVEGFFRGIFGAPALGNAPGSTVGTHQGHRFCRIEGEVVTYVLDGAEENEFVTRAEFRPMNAFPANTWIRVHVKPGAMSRSGVALGNNGYTQYFGTSSNICPLRQVTVSPESTLFSKLAAPNKDFTAHARSADGQKIVQVAEYSWNWRWTPQVDEGALTSPMVLISTPDPDGGELNVAQGYVRGRETTDTPAGYDPKNGQAKVEVSAIIVDPSDASRTRVVMNTSLTSNGGTPNDTSDDVLAGKGGDVTVMLCDNPWPARVSCSGSAMNLPWEDAGTPKHECPANTSIWFPFYDAATNFEFYYCRDGQGESATPQLPAFKEVPVRVFPGGNILREYLFTYDLARGPLDSVTEWSRDAIGLRVVSNQEHLGPFAWYVAQGFRGNPINVRVDGYEAVRDGRTTYVDAAAMTSTGDLYTNINVLSHNDGASTETTAIFNQILENIDFNRQPELADTQVCRAGGETVIIDDAVVSCTTDLDCEVEGKRGVCSGDSVTACSTVDDCTFASVAGPCVRMECHAPKAALVRDVKRFADMQSLRSTLLTKPLPSIDAGSFMRGRTYSAWSSWAQQFGAAIGGAPVDPVNAFDSCPPGFDAQTCWDATQRLFTCPADSYVYLYRSLGTNAELYADLEFRDEAGNAKWKGTTCLDRTTSSSCGAQAGCVWTGDHCTFATVGVHLGGLFGTDTMCSGHLEGQNGSCGDGVVNDNDNGPDEVCEPGQLRAASCTVGNRAGFKTQQCASDCLGWTDVAGGTCQAGSCGDGVVQGPEEACDDGVLNGMYGHCNSACTGQGFSCGDGQVQPGEACDCADRNGSYAIDGVLALPGDTCTAFGANSPSCAWDCSGAGPRCGDGVINGSEVCDGGVQVSKGYCSISREPCASAGSCAEGGGSCILAPTVEQNYRRSCNNNLTNTTLDNNAGGACRWALWTLTAPGQCGNGITETGEQCDDGNSVDADACTNVCKLNVCGDGFVNGAGGESCDDGPANGVLCVPDYNGSCRYCRSTCTVGQVSGGFCGDRIEQTPDSPAPFTGPEQCDKPNEPLGNNYVCVSTLEKDKSFGKYVGQAVCTASSCSNGCLAMNAEVCLNGSITASNTDAETCANVTGAAQILCQQQKDTYATMPATHTYYNTLRNDCDPDDDNDGVPDAYDCGPLDPAVHPTYRIPGTDIEILPATEYCDGVDNDCDGFVDDDWTTAPRTAAEGVTLTGVVHDAMFPGVEISGATVEVRKMLCSNDKRTQCSSNEDCGGYECGIPVYSVVTGSDGYYDLGTIRRPKYDSSGGYSCPMKVQVLAHTPANDLSPASDPSLVFMTPGDELFQRKDRGYYSMQLDIPVTESTRREDVYLMPVPLGGTTIVSFVWDGTLGTYLDAWLSIPGTFTGTYTASNGTSYTPVSRFGYQYQYQGSLAQPPYARLVCDSASSSGDPTSCTNFRTAPQLMVYTFASGSPLNDGDQKTFYVDAYGCGSNCRSKFTSVNARAYIAWSNGGYCNGGTEPFTYCVKNADCDGGGTCSYGNVCVNGTRIGPFCSANSDCTGGGTCVATNAFVNGGYPIYATAGRPNPVVDGVSYQGSATSDGGNDKYWRIFTYSWYAAGGYWIPSLDNRFTSVLPTP